MPRKYKKLDNVVSVVELKPSGVQYVKLEFNIETATFARMEEDRNVEFVCMELMFLKSKLELRGFLFINDILDALGMELVPIGQTNGWLARDNNFKFDIDTRLDDPIRGTVHIQLENASEMYQHIQKARGGRQ